MNKQIVFILALYFLLNSSLRAATNNSNDLVKITPNSNVKCVEYYKYKGELYCSTTAHSSEPPDPRIKSYEKLNIVFDDRPWLAAWGKEEPEAFTVVEYVPKGEDINNWNELITSQFFPDLQLKTTPKQFAELFIKKLKDSGYQPSVTFLEDTPDKVIFEYRIKGPQNQQQDELLMITEDKKGLYVLHYVIKKADMDQKNRALWLQNLKNSTIKK